MKVRKRCQSAQLQTELIELLKHMFLPPKKMIKEQVIFQDFSRFQEIQWQESLFVNN